jgi:ethanolamine ammonia-lyase small subunit
MPEDDELGMSSLELPDLVRRIRERTPARVLVGRPGCAYTTDTQLSLRRDHAAARDAVQAELDLEEHLGRDFVRIWSLFEVKTCAGSKSEYLLRPGLGRVLSEASREQVLRQCQGSADVQIIIGDGLSVSAVRAQVPSLLPLLCAGARQRGWQLGQSFVIRHCRVGVLNDIGELLDPKIVVLLIGERPGMSTAESLSAYMAHRPRRGNTDADRNLISNIHSRGVPVQYAATRILNLAARMLEQGTSGSCLKEQLSSGQQPLAEAPYLNDGETRVEPLPAVKRR